MISALLYQHWGLVKTRASVQSWPEGLQSFCTELMSSSAGIKFKIRESGNVCWQQEMALCVCSIARGKILKLGLAGWEFPNLFQHMSYLKISKMLAKGLSTQLLYFHGPQVGNHYCRVNSDVITYTTGTVRHHQVLLKGLFFHRGWERWT